MDNEPWINIVYTGTIYQGKQDPSKLLQAVSELVKTEEINPDDISIEFYGDTLCWLDESIGKYGLANIVKQYGRVKREVVLQKQREARILWLMLWEDKDEKGVIPLKFYEYLAAGRPILATGGFEDEVSKQVKENWRGLCCHDVESIKWAIMSMM